MSGLSVQIDISDWEREALSDETPIEDRQDILERLEAGNHTAAVARAAVVWREKNVAPGDIIGPNKVLLQTGAQLEVSRIARGAKREIVARNGRAYKAPALVGQVPDGREKEEGALSEESYISSHDKRARERAEQYLLEVVPGHIWNRLLVIYANGGDIEEVTSRLKERINKQVYDLLYDKSKE